MAELTGRCPRPVMAGLVPAIHAEPLRRVQITARDAATADCRRLLSIIAAPDGVDGRDKPGHDGGWGG